MIQQPTTDTTSRAATCGSPTATPLKRSQRALAHPGLRAHEGGARRVVGVVELEDLRVWRDGQAREGQRLRLLRLVRVLRALEDLEVAEEIAAVGVLGQHALDRLLDDALPH